MSFGECITNLDGLRSIYREPSDPVVAKAIDHVDEGVRAFLAKEKPNFEVVSAAHSQTGAAGPA